MKYTCGCEDRPNYRDDAKPGECPEHGNPVYGIVTTKAVQMGILTDARISKDTPSHGKKVDSETAIGPNSGVREQSRGT